MRTRLVAGNWKLNGSRAMCDELLGAVLAKQSECGATQIAICPPAVYLAYCADLLSDSSVTLGAQDVSAHESGAHTGELAAAMLREVGCGLTLCGHSERRADHGESDALVAAKCDAAIKAGLTAVLCVGETEAQREAGETETVISRQLHAVLDKLSRNALESLIVAYEPVWAIGTGKTATPEQAQQVHALIRSQISAVDATMGGRTRILYGGSVKGGNAAELFGQPDIDGGLIGGASLTAADFLSICRA